MTRTLLDAAALVPVVLCSGGAGWWLKTTLHAHEMERQIRLALTTVNRAEAERMGR